MSFPHAPWLNFHFSVILAPIDTILRQINKAKKPLGMALFLPIVLVIYGFVTIGDTAYQVHIGILGGPSVASAEDDYFGGNLAILESHPSPANSPDFNPEQLIQENDWEAALIQGRVQAAKTKASNSIISAEGPDLKGYFSMPTEGFDWGKLHLHNAVDIANACGTNITASAEGLVNEVSLDSWSQGYGRYIIISHPNGTKTRYAHMQKISVSVGQYVKSGEFLGTMGKTGDATGCHVHFEVIGAANPFAK